MQAAWPARRSGGADGACARQAALCARRVANHAPKGAVAVDSRRSAQLPWRLTDGIGRRAGAKQSKKCNLYLEIFRAWKPAHGHPPSFYRDTHPRPCAGLQGLKNSKCRLHFLLCLRDAPGSLAAAPLGCECAPTQPASALRCLAPEIRFLSAGMRPEGCCVRFASMAIRAQALQYVSPAR